MPSLRNNETFWILTYDYQGHLEWSDPLDMLDRSAGVGNLHILLQRLLLQRSGPYLVPGVVRHNIGLGGTRPISKQLELQKEIFKPSGMYKCKEILRLDDRLLVILLRCDYIRYSRKSVNYQVLSLANRRTRLLCADHTSRETILKTWDGKIFHFHANFPLLGHGRNFSCVSR